MGKRGTCPLWKCCKVFLWISSYSKTPYWAYLCIIFTTCRRLLRALPQTPTGIHPWTSLEYFCPETPNLPTPGKNPACPSCILIGYACGLRRPRVPFSLPTVRNNLHSVVLCRAQAINLCR